MSLSINYLNTVKVPFPPAISVDEIVQIHLKNGIKNVNITMNPFMIYRKEYNRVVAKFNLSSKDVSKFVSISWQNEPEDVKDYYQQMAKNVKECFKKKVPFYFFINSYQVHSINDNHVPSSTVNPSLHNTNQNFPPPLNQSINDPPQNFLNSTYFTYNFNIPPSNTDQIANHPLLNIEQDSQPIVSDNFKNYHYTTMDEDEFMNHPLPNIGQDSQPIVSEGEFMNYPPLNINDLHEYMAIGDDEFMNLLSEDMALTYKAIIQSLPL
ncbi:5210_t:CDS:1 [Diversispora eburnea]|uniref:5210_t:CDS:1 n=1 Tax=Diversispora eburnea TaxID=1213867 RepID=A0A9N9GH83_9GLOM|nr:5210_t:CDS:1 [Diversispora eburnea]